MSKISYLNIAPWGTVALYAAPSSICTDLIVGQANLIFQGALYCSAFGSMLHTRVVVWYSWVRDIDVHLETDLDILCIGNLGYLLQHTCDTLQHFILHTFPTTSSSATTVVRPERFAAFRPSFMRQEWTPSHFPLSGFEGSLSSVYILYSILKILVLLSILITKTHLHK